MTIAYSGGLAYEYTLEANGYGLVEMKNGQVVPNEDFDRLKAAYEETPIPEGDGGARKTRTVPACPPETEEWQVSTTLLPEMPTGAQKFFEDGAGDGPGLEGEGSQWHGTPSETEPDLSNGVATTEAQDSNFSESGTSGGNSSSSGGSESAASSGSQPVMFMSVAALALVAAFAL